MGFRATLNFRKLKDLAHVKYGIWTGPKEQTFFAAQSAYHNDYNSVINSIFSWFKVNALGSWHGWLFIAWEI